MPNQPPAHPADHPDPAGRDDQGAPVWPPPTAPPPAWPERSARDPAPDPDLAWERARLRAGWDPSAVREDDPDDQPASAAEPGPPLPWETLPGEPDGQAPPKARRRGRLVAVAVVAVLALAVAGTYAAVRRDDPTRAAGPAVPAPQVVRGAGYTFALPAGWTDQTVRLSGSFPASRPDRAFTSGATDGLAANLNVFRSPAQGRQPTLAQLPPMARASIATALDARPVGGLRTLTVAGEPAVAYDYAFTQDGKPAQARQVAFYHAGQLYIVTFTAHQRAFPAEVAILDRVAGSWSWS